MCVRSLVVFHGDARWLGRRLSAIRVTALVGITHAHLPLTAFEEDGLRLRSKTDHTGRRLRFGLAHHLRTLHQLLCLVV